MHSYDYAQPYIVSGVTAHVFNENGVVNNYVNNTRSTNSFYNAENTKYDSGFYVGGFDVFPQYPLNGYISEILIYFSYYNQLCHSLYSLLWQYVALYKDETWYYFLLRIWGIDLANLKF